MKDNGGKTINFTFNFNAHVGQNIAHVDTLNAHFDKDMKMQVVDWENLNDNDNANDNPNDNANDNLNLNEGEGESILPASLATEEAMEMWAKLRKRDLIDEDYQPTMSQKRAAILASVMSDILQLSPRWAAFEQLWGIKDLSTKLSQAQNTQYYPQVLQQIEKVLI